MKIDVAGVQIDNVSKAEAIEKIDSFVQSGGYHYVVTPYSEMVVFAQRDEKYRQALNYADLAIPDGVGIIWGAKFLSLKGNWLTSLWQIVYTGAAIVFKKQFVSSIIKEQITGRKFIFDLAKLAETKKYSVALVGGDASIAAHAANNLKKQFPNLKVNLAISGRPFNDQIIKEINDSNSDILLIAYSPPKQEMWLYDNREKLNSKVAIGLGGTFDYLAGKRLTPPNFMHHMGLEWLWRLITQPWRIKRIWNAVPVFVWKVYRYKNKV